MPATGFESSRDRWDAAGGSHRFSVVGTGLAGKVARWAGVVSLSLFLLFFVFNARDPAVTEGKGRRLRSVLGSSDQVVVPNRFRTNENAARTLETLDVSGLLRSSLIGYARRYSGAPLKTASEDPGCPSRLRPKLATRAKEIDKAIKGNMDFVETLAKLWRCRSFSI